MTEDNKEITKEEKIEKAKVLMKELKELQLSDDDLQKVAGGTKNEIPTFDVLK